MVDFNHSALRELLAKITAIQNYYVEEWRELDLPSHINQPNTSGDAAIHVAARSFGPEEIALLLENGADVNLAGEFGATPLHCAASSKRLDNFVFLLKKGADPDRRMYLGIKAAEMIVGDEALRCEFERAVAETSAR